eukprot:403348980
MQYQQQHAPAPQVVIVQQQSTHQSKHTCPKCNKNAFFKVRKYGLWTCVVCWCCSPYLCMKCAWYPHRICAACGHKVKM